MQGMREASPGLWSKGDLWHADRTGCEEKRGSYRNIDISLIYACSRNTSSLSGLHTQLINVAQLSLQNNTGTFHWRSLSAYKIYSVEMVEFFL